MNHLGIFPRVVWSLLWWIGYWEVYCAIASVLMLWMRVIQADFTKLLSQRIIKVSNIMVWATLVIFFPSVLVSMLQDSYVEYPSVIYSIFYGLLILTMLATMILFIILGFRMLKLTWGVQTNQGLLFQRVTMMVLGCGTGFLAFMITVIYRAYFVILSHELTFTSALGLDVAWDVILGLVITAVNMSFLLNNIRSVLRSTSDGGKTGSTSGKEYASPSRTHSQDVALELSAVHQ